MLESLIRLRSNNYQFTISRTAQMNIQELMFAANNVADFLNGMGNNYIEFDPCQPDTYYASTRELYTAYRRWCQDNVEFPESEASFSAYLKQHHEEHCLQYRNNIPIGNGKLGRGYRGIRTVNL